MHPVTVRVRSPEPPHTGNLVFDAKASEFCCDCGDIGHDESELHPGDWSVARREKLKNGTGLTDLTVDQVWSTWLVVVKELDADSAVECCGLVYIDHEEGEFQQRMCSHRDEFRRTV